MKYFYKPKTNSYRTFCNSFQSNNTLYKTVSLYLAHNGKGLAIVQQHFDPVQKISWWGELDPSLANDIYLSDGFVEFFKANAKEATDGEYPTFPVRKVMWALRMKPLKKEFWET